MTHVPCPVCQVLIPTEYFPKCVACDMINMISIVEKGLTRDNTPAGTHHLLNTLQLFKRDLQAILDPL